ncbi:MAG: glycosyltransferase family 2 protein [Gemmatimonadetes bacterium]|nr:glycosyltransferase family 2 protein [Gemmatimonadota bacterium]NIT87140.1 glycosyltransferase family 2 protein [Gemmatimonadota bacterium]NIV61341.1 glycosyltransferase [Gemmatimonadota bacterium]
MPALNEEASLPGLLRGLARAGVGTVVVVDNGSSDRTATVAAAEGATVLREEERGYGAACIRGIEHLAFGDDPPTALAFVDADARAELAHLSRLVGPVLRDEADLVLGVREGPAGRPGNLHFHARLGNHLVLGCARLLFGLRHGDLAPFRAVRFPSLLALEMDDRNWGWTLQMQIRAHRKGLRVREIAVPHRPRSAGRSKISGSLGASVRVGAKMFYTLLRERFRGVPVSPGWGRHPDSSSSSSRKESTASREGRGRSSWGT